MGEKQKNPLQIQGAFCSAKLPVVQTSYMKLRLPFRSIHDPRGKLIFTLDTSRTKDFLDNPEECLASLKKKFSPPAH
jgi:hypothetical protein